VQAKEIPTITANCLRLTRHHGQNEVLRYFSSKLHTNNTKQHYIPLDCFEFSQELIWQKCQQFISYLLRFFPLQLILIIV